MIKFLILVCLFGCASCLDIRYYLADDIRMIQTYDKNYAITSSAMKQVGCDGGVSINNAEAVMYMTGCTKKTSSVLAFNTDERKALLKSLNGVATAIWDPRSLNKFASIKFSDDVIVNSILNDGFDKNKPETRTKQGTYVTYLQDRECSFYGNKIKQTKLNRLFVSGDIITLVHEDGQVEIKPARCLDDNEMHILMDELRGLEPRCFNEPSMVLSS